VHPQSCLRHVVALSLLVVLPLACGGGAGTRDRPALPAPDRTIVATGDGKEAGGYFGPPGGELRLAPQGPTVLVPADPRRQAGIALALEKDEAVAAAGSPVLGSAFRLSAVLEPPSGTFVQVRSVELSSLPAPCTTDNLELAVLGSPQVGTTPALAWTYEKAAWEGGYVKAQLPKLAPHPLQFVCGRGGTGGEP
jgi:hypothetical protein